MNSKNKSAPEEPPHPVVGGKNRMPKLCITLTTFVCLLAISCTSSKYLLTESIVSQNISNLPSNAAFTALIRLTIAKLNEMDGKDLVRALDDAASIQTSDTLSNLVHSKISQYVGQNMGNEDRKKIITLLLDFMSFRYAEVERQLQNLTPTILVKNGVMNVLPVMYLRLGDKNAKENVTYRNFPFDALSPLRQRTLEYHTILNGNPALALLTSIHSQSKLTKDESRQVLPVYLKTSDYKILRYIFSHADDFHLGLETALTILTHRANSKDLCLQTDSLAFAYVSSLQNINDETANNLAELVCANEMRTCAKVLTRHIKDSTHISGVCLLKLGWYVYSESQDSTKRIWEIASTKLDTSSFDYKSTTAYLAVIEGNDTLSRYLLRSLILEYPQTVLSRKIYLDFLLDDFDLTKLSNFLQHSKESLDSLVFQDHFSAIHIKTIVAELLNFYLWQNSKGVKYWVYKDTANTLWLYDKNFDPLNTSVFVNTKNDTMFWVYEDGREYLFNEDNTYANQYRFKNSEGKYVNAIIENGYTYYYDEEYKWTEYKSYTNKSGRAIYIKTSSNYEYFYNDSLEYMNIYSYSTQEGNKMFVEEKGLLEIYYDSTWTPTGLIGFSNNQALRAFVYSDNVKFFCYNENSNLSSLNVTIYKDKQDQIFIEDGDIFRHYYNINGDDLGWSIWMTDGKISSIAVPYKGACKQLLAGDLIDCSSYSSQNSNLYSEKEYLHRAMITELATFISSQSETPYEIFTGIATDIEKRKHQEVALAILQGISQGLESYNNSMQAYRQKTYESPATTYTNSYIKNTSTNTYSNSLQNSNSNTSYTHTGNSRYFDYSDNYNNRLSGSTNYLGDNTYTTIRGSGGYRSSGSSYSIGDYDYYNYRDNQGNRGSGSSYDIGDTKYYNYRDNTGNKINANSTNIGDYEYFSGRDNNSTRYSGSSYRVGDFVYSNMKTSDGKKARGTTYKIGSTTYTDWKISE